MRSLECRDLPSGRVLAALAGVALLAGCSSSDLLGSSKPAPETPGASPSISDRMNSWLFSPYAATPATPGTTQPAEPDCPGVDVRKGASTYAVGATPREEPTAATTRYQATISQTARECVSLGATMTIKVGVQGRVILGPAGGP